eukprot:GHVQ01002135.1.p1 GENE.GHVQ01002135.1~~GHVQ01002135.1.p1  ORF type:complete len:155 (+),score=17.20 GHVQ01002135.1:146-610(+)
MTTVRRSNIPAWRLLEAKAAAEGKFCWRNISCLSAHTVFRSPAYRDGGSGNKKWIDSRGGVPAARLKEPLEFCELYRSILSAAREFANPMFKAYFCRRAREQFREKLRLHPNREHRTASGLPEFYREMNDHKMMLDRQAAISHMFHYESLLIKR